MADRERLIAEQHRLQAEAEAESDEVHFAIAQQTLKETTSHRDTDAMSQQRGGAIVTNGKGGSI